MKYFKIKKRRIADRYEITKETFLNVTNKKYPFEQTNSQGKIVQYGICPSCLNSIQLIGITRELKVKPYGKHTGKTINGFPSLQQRKYEFCPFAAKNEHRNPNDNERSPEIDESVIELYNLLKNQLDRVVYVVSRELGIRASTVFWRNVLRQYLVNEVYCYPWLTESNLPYIFAYFGMTHHRAYKQKIRIGTDLYNNLHNYKGVKFEKEENGYAQLVNEKGFFLNLEFRFTNHVHKVIEGETLVESMLFCVDDITTGKTIHEQHIEFNETYFMNLIKSPKYADKRQRWLLDIANELMKPLQSV